MVWDARRCCLRKAGIIPAPICLPSDEHPLLLVVSRPEGGRKPRYLITTEPVLTAEQVWQMVIAHAGGWRIGMSLRFTKSELDFDSPRLQA